MVKVKNYLNLKVKLLGEILRYDLYYSLIYHLKWKLLSLKLA
jgi:hypothetical protein